MASSTTSMDPGLAQVIASLKDRLVQTGEWDRILAQLRSTLDDSQWSDDLRTHARQRAAETQPGSLDVKQLMDDVAPYAKATIPAEIRDELLASLRAFVQENVE